MFDIDFLKKLNILFVEDEPTSRDLLINILADLFNNFIVAQNGQEGLEKFQEFSKDGTIDIIISDIDMPILDGLSMIEKIREINQDIPVIFTTGKDDSQSILKAVSLGINHYITKPVNTKDLLTKISLTCEKKYYETMFKEKKKELEIYLKTIEHVVSIYKMDKHGHIFYANESFLEISKYSIEEIMSKNFEDLIHPDIPKKYIEETWDDLRNNRVCEKNTKFIDKEGETFYLQATIFKLQYEQKDEFITIGFLTTKENLEKREFHKKVLKSVQEFNKKEVLYKKTIVELNEQLKTIEKALPQLQKELEEERSRSQSKERQINHYEMQMMNLDNKQQVFLQNKVKELEECQKVNQVLKQERMLIVNRNKDLEVEIASIRKEMALLIEANEQKNKRIFELEDVVKNYDFLEREQKFDEKFGIEENNH